MTDNTKRLRQEARQEAGELIKQLRQHSGLKKKQLAKLAAVKKSDITALERGKKGITLTSALSVLDVIRKCFKKQESTTKEPT